MGYKSIADITVVMVVRLDAVGSQNREIGRNSDKI